MNATSNRIFRTEHFLPPDRIHFADRQFSIDLVLCQALQTLTNHRHHDCMDMPASTVNMTKQNDCFCILIFLIHLHTKTF